ncbi:hypothetical protein JOM56_012717, partial [Amanita muscaria]
VYMPLHLFTNKNLRILNREGATLATTKISTSAAKGKDNSVKILDLTKFETLHGSEESLSQAQWSEAVRNYIRFFDSLDQESLSQRWEDHFGFFEEREDLVENFNAILILDIKMRKDYVAQPFSFSMQYYALELEKMIRDTQVQRLEDLLKGGKSGAPSSFLSSTKRQRLPLSTLAGQSFQPGTHGDPSTAVCVICARRGHFWNACGRSNFEDGKPLFAKADRRDIASIKGKSLICRSWNIKGSTANVCNNHEQDK